MGCAIFRNAFNQLYSLKLAAKVCVFPVEVFYRKLNNGMLFDYSHEVSTVVLLFRIVQIGSLRISNQLYDKSRTFEVMKSKCNCFL